MRFQGMQAMSTLPQVGNRGVLMTARIIAVILVWCLVGCTALFDALSPLAKPSSGAPDTSSAAGREGPLHGQVVAEDGRPVAGIKVTAYLSGVTPKAPYRIAADEHRSPEARRLAAGT